MQIRCSVCKELLKPDDPVFLDVVNGLSHITCFNLPPSTIRDVGVYRDILNKYEFFSNKMKTSLH